MNFDIVIGAVISLSSVMLANWVNSRNNQRNIEANNNQLELKLKHDQKMRLIEKKTDVYPKFLEIFYPTFQQKYINEIPVDSVPNHPFYDYQKLVQPILHSTQILSDVDLNKKIHEHVKMTFSRMRKGILQPSDEENDSYNEIISKMKKELGIEGDFKDIVKKCCK